MFVSVYVCAVHILIVSFFRPNLDELTSFLKDLGATEVITEEYLASREMRKLLTVSLKYIHIALYI